MKRQEEDRIRKQRDGIHAKFHSKAHVSRQLIHERTKHTHTQSLKNKSSIRQGMVEKAINEKARGCWEQARQRETNKNTLEAAHAHTTHAHTHPQPALIPSTSLHTGESNREACSSAMNFTGPELAERKTKPTK